LRIEPADVLLFRDASHDVNPLHLSPEYARRTPFGEPVVYGVLGLLAAIARIAARARERVARVDATFLGPLYAGADYELAISESGERVSLEIRGLLKARIAYSAGPPEKASWPAAPDLRTQPNTPTEIVPGIEIGGTWAPEPSAVEALAARFGLRERGLSSATLSAMIASSYLVGMEFPGQNALFSSLALEFGDGAPRAEWRLAVNEVDSRFDRVVASVEIGAVARGTLVSFVRSELRSDLAELRSLVASPRLEGKSALIVGGSRGLGASIARLVSLHGARTWVSYSRSVEAARALGAEVRVSLLQQDAADPHWKPPVAELDLLVLAACPPLRPVRPDQVDVIARHVEESLRLVMNPLAACTPALTRAKGTVVVLSSQAVHTRPKAWPHYVAAKAAIETLTRFASDACPGVRFVVARPGKMLTDLVNTPGARIDAIPPSRVALRLLDALLVPATAAIEWLEADALR
jgi:NAD(P)-dependent dehydrogenase (short-subunit alcohol dehydrogenase family)